MKSRKINCSQKIDCGFTLIELLYCGCDCGRACHRFIISYQNYIVRENRQLAEHSLSAAAKMEQYYAQNGRYTNGSGAWPSLDGRKHQPGSSGTVYTFEFSTFYSQCTELCNFGDATR